VRAGPTYELYLWLHGEKEKVLIMLPVEFDGALQTGSGPKSLRIV
jgi:hypothetical protein